MKKIFLIPLTLFSFAVLAARGYTIAGKLISYNNEGLLIQHESGKKLRLNFKETSLSKDSNYAGLLGRRVEAFVSQEVYDRLLTRKLGQ